jgi:hypothetical protein
VSKQWPELGINKKGAICFPKAEIGALLESTRRTGLAPWAALGEQKEAWSALETFRMRA